MRTSRLSDAAAEAAYRLSGAARLFCCAFRFLWAPDATEYLIWHALKRRAYGEHPSRLRTYIERIAKIGQ